MVQMRRHCNCDEFTEFMGHDGALEVHDIHTSGMLLQPGDGGPLLVRIGDSEAAKA